MPRSLLTLLLLSNPALAQETYFPLHEGNRWSYEGDYPGTPLATTTARVDGRLWSGVTHLSDFPGFAGGVWVAFAGTDLHVWNPAIGTWVSFLRFGAPAGSQYLVSLGLSGWWAVRVRLESKTAEVRDPYLARTFRNCARFTFAGTASGEAVFAPGVGLVRWRAGDAVGLLRSARVGSSQLGRPVLGPSSRIAGRFALGVNYPWLQYGNDFGGNAWGNYGVHAGGTYAADFADLKAKGVRVVRWFVFADMRGGITFDPSGTPTGINSWVRADFQAALDLAETHDLRLLPVLFDFHVMKPKKIVSGVQTGGRSEVLSHPAKRKALVDRVVKPLLAAFAAHPRVYAWEIMNEPEWGIALPGTWTGGEMVLVPMAHFWSFASEVSAAVHAVARTYVTIGSASLKWHRVWTNAYAAAHDLPPLNLDFYQTHFYAWMDSGSWTNHPHYGTTKWSPLQQSYWALGLDRPMIVGELEVPAGTVSARFGKILANGYAGAMPWSYRADIPVDWEGFAAWAQQHAPLLIPSN